MGDKPIKVFSYGGVKSSVWEKKKDGITFYSAKIVKVYKDGEEWKETNSYNANDIPKLSHVADKTFEFIFFKEQELESK